MELDLTTLRSAVTLLSFIVFAGIVYWACDGKNLPRFDEAANLPFQEGDEELLEPTRAASTAATAADNSTRVTRG